MEFVAIVWLGLAIATGAAARSRGRDGGGWFVLAVIISPLLALILLMAFPARPRGRTKLCQFCRSEVAADATVCAHCQRDIDTPQDIAARKDAIIRRGNRVAFAVLCFAACLVIFGFFAVGFAPKSADQSSGPTQLARTAMSGTQPSASAPQPAPTPGIEKQVPISANPAPAIKAAAVEKDNLAKISGADVAARSPNDPTDDQRQAGSLQLKRLLAPQFLSRSELDAMRVRLASLWNVQPGIEHPEELYVTVRIRLNPDRRLAAPPQVVSTGSSPRYQAAADAAVKAVVEGQPYTMLRDETYEQWKYMDIDFDPKQLLHEQEAGSRGIAASFPPPLVGRLTAPPQPQKPADKQSSSIKR